MRQKVNLVISLIFASFIFCDLEFITVPSTRAGWNIPLRKQKTGLPKVDGMGEDSLSMYRLGATVCDGVGGSKFLAYFLAELFAVAAADAHLRSAESLSLEFKEKILEKSARKSSEENWQAELDLFGGTIEASLDAYAFAYQAFLSDLLTKRTSKSNLNNLQTEPQPISDHVTAFEKLAKTKNDKNAFNALIFSNQRFKLPKNSNLLPQIVAGISTTFISAAPRTVGDEDRLAVYKYGDSLLTTFRLVLTPDKKKVFFEPYYITYDFQPEFNKPKQLVSYYLSSSAGDYARFRFNYDIVFKSAYGDKQEIKDQKAFMKKNTDTTEHKLFTIPVRANDLTVIASDGLYDNMPTSLITLLLNTIFKFLTEELGVIEALFTELQDQGIQNYMRSKPNTEDLRGKMLAIIEGHLMELMEDIMVHYAAFASDPETLSVESLEKLKTLVYLQRFRPHAHITEEEHDLREAQKSDNPFKRCSAYQVFFTRWVGHADESRKAPVGLLSKCMESVVGQEVGFDLENLDFVLQHWFDIKMVSKVLVSAAKVFTLVNTFARALALPNHHRAKLEESALLLGQFQEKLQNPHSHINLDFEEGDEIGSTGNFKKHENLLLNLLDPLTEQKQGSILETAEKAFEISKPSVSREERFYDFDGFEEGTRDLVEDELDSMLSASTLRGIADIWSQDEKKGMTDQTPAQLVGELPERRSDEKNDSLEPKDRVGVFLKKQEHDEESRKSEVEQSRYEQALHTAVSRIRDEFNDELEVFRKHAADFRQVHREAWLELAKMTSPANLDAETANPLLAIAERIAGKIGLAIGDESWLEENLPFSLPKQKYFLSIFEIRYHIFNRLPEFTVDKDFGAKEDDITAIVTCLRKKKKEDKTLTVLKAELGDRLRAWEKMFTLTIDSWFFSDSGTKRNII